MHPILVVVDNIHLLLYILRSVGYNLHRGYEHRAGGDHPRLEGLGTGGFRIETSHQSHEFPLEPSNQLDKGLATLDLC